MTLRLLILYDENISEVLRKFEIKVGDLENVSISENSLKQAGINTALNR
jgi:DNA-directed RNA polymerase alpha subunit